jgi:phosphonate transport system permease protein
MPSTTSRPLPIGPRGAVLLLLLLAGAAAWWGLGLRAGQLVPHAGGLEVVGRFFERALTPALSYESEVPSGTTPLPLKALDAARRTLVFAAAAMTLAILIGIVLGFPASSAWWEGDPGRGRSFLRRAVAPLVWGATRAVIALLRSVHELLWAVLFLAAFGLNTFSAVVAIAIPYGGTLAKIFSEMIDEAARDSANALRASGATGAQVFWFGLLPRALPDLAAYSFYRFECAVRSSAILGFFGYETLGYFLRQSFENLHYGETWTYLWTLFFLVAVLDLWSGRLRRRFAT